MYDSRLFSLGLRDVVAAWLVCLALIALVFIYPLLSDVVHHPAPQAQAAPPHPAVCAADTPPVRIPHG